MKEVCQAISIILEFFSVIFLSMGLLSPQTVKSSKNVLQSLVGSEPNNIIGQCAYIHTIKSVDNKRTNDRCVTHLLVDFMSLIISWYLIITVLATLSMLYLFRYGNFYYLPSFGLFLSLTGICAIMEGRLSDNVSGIKKGLYIFINIFKYPSWLIFPLVYITWKIITLFTILIPKLWYFFLKKIYNKGIAWLFGLIGVFLLLVSVTIRLIII